MSPTPKRKTNPDHKASFSFSVAANCSCGWQSTNWFGKGAQRNAAGEWRSHLSRIECNAKQEG